MNMMPTPRMSAGRICTVIGTSHAARDCELPVPPMKLVPYVNQYEIMIPAVMASWKENESRG
jgi:hypothetical protein